MKYLKEKAKESKLNVNRQKSLFAHTVDLDKAWKLIRKKGKKREAKARAAYVFKEEAEFDGSERESGQW